MQYLLTPGGLNPIPRLAGTDIRYNNNNINNINISYWLYVSWVVGAGAIWVWLVKKVQWG